MKVLAIDVGSSAIKVQVFDARAAAIEGLAAVRAQRVETGPDGRAEADADRLIERIAEALDEVCEKCRAAGVELAAVAGCSFVGNVLGLDAQGRPAGPLVTYADTRARREAAELRERLDEAAVHQRTGCRLHAAYLPAQLLWQARQLRGATRFVSLGEYLELALFGACAMSYSVASWTGLLDREKLCWDEDLLGELPFGAEALSALCDVASPRAGLREPWASRWPALARIPWHPFVGDGAAANLGSGCSRPGRVALSMGSTTAMRIVREEAVGHLPPALWCYRVDTRRRLLGGALSEGGNVFDWLRQSLSLPPGDRLEREIAVLPPDGHGLTVLPLLAGERSPGWAAEALGCIQGLSLSTRPVQIVRAAMEAVALRSRLVLDALAPLAGAELEIVASGGALASSPAWVQIMADALERPIRLSTETQASARGAALLALEALGALSAGYAPAPLGPAVLPRPEHAGAFRAALARQGELYAAILGERGQRE
ncbi:MAG: gluconokinase [Deltaproteobacteria bacterium]|nr:gluconokinase [Deltaproteobacteria bacterium]